MFQEVVSTLILNHGLGQIVNMEWQLNDSAICIHQEKLGVSEAVG
jgi:hypothetical protein